jgi:hypothetical protein
VSVKIGTGLVALPDRDPLGPSRPAALLGPASSASTEEPSGLPWTSPESIPCRPVDEPWVVSQAIRSAARSRAEWVGDPVPSRSMARLRTDLGTVREMARCVALESGLKCESELPASGSAGVWP